jgi:hypothetical protein
MTTKTYDALQEWLREQGCPSHVVKAGLKGLMLAWEKIVAELVFDGYRYGLRDFVNDMDKRQILDGALARARELGIEIPPLVASRVASADERFRDATWPASRCLADDETAAAKSLRPEQHVWYYRLPRRRRGFIVKDLEAAGITAIES